VGQILNAAAGPLVMATPSLLASVWFPDHERTTATAIAVLANGVGTAVGFLLGPWLAPTADALPTLLYAEIGIAALPALAIAAHFPAAPATPPSPAAAKFASDLKHERVTPFFAGLGRIVRMPSLWLIVCAGGIQKGAYVWWWWYVRGGCMVCAVFVHVGECVFACACACVCGTQAKDVLDAGVSSAWQSIIPQILGAVGYSPSVAGYYGFASTVAGLVGCFVCGRLADLYFPRRMKALSIAIFVTCAGLFVWLTMTLPSPFGGPFAPNGAVAIVSAITLAGFFQGALDPVRAVCAGSLGGGGCAAARC
jgi:MFS family permease